MIVFETMAWVTEPEHGVFRKKDSEVKDHHQWWHLYLKSQLKPDDTLQEYFIRAQEVMTKLSDAGGCISKTIFMTLVLNGLPKRFEFRGNKDQQW